MFYAALGVGIGPAFKLVHVLVVGWVGSSLKRERLIEPDFKILGGYGQNAISFSVPKKYLCLLQKI